MAKNQELEDKESELHQLTMEIEKLSEFKSVIQTKHTRVSPDHVSYEELDDLRVSLEFFLYSRVPNNWKRPKKTLRSIKMAPYQLNFINSDVKNI